MVHYKLRILLRQHVFQIQALLFYLQEEKDICEGEFFQELYCQKQHLPFLQTGISSRVFSADIISGPVLQTLRLLHGRDAQQVSVLLKVHRSGQGLPLNPVIYAGPVHS